MQDEITAAVAGVIEPALAEAEQQRVLRKPPDRLNALEAYQRGLWHFHKYDKQNNDAAQAFFRQAIALDAKFAACHPPGDALALHWDIWHFSVRDFAEVQGTPRAEALIAVSLDDKDQWRTPSSPICACGAANGRRRSPRHALASRSTRTAPS